MQPINYGQSEGWMIELHSATAVPGIFPNLSTPGVHRFTPDERCMSHSVARHLLTTMLQGA